MLRALLQTPWTQGRRAMTSEDRNSKGIMYSMFQKRGEQRIYGVPLQRGSKILVWRSLTKLVPIPRPPPQNTLVKKKTNCDLLHRRRGIACV